MKNLIKFTFPLFLIFNILNCTEGERIVVTEGTIDYRNNFDRNIGQITFYKRHPFTGILKNSEKMEWKPFEITFKDGIEIDWKWWRDGKEVTYEQWNHVEMEPLPEVTM